MSHNTKCQELSYPQAGCGCWGTRACSRARKGSPLWSQDKGQTQSCVQPVGVKLSKQRRDCFQPFLITAPCSLVGSSNRFKYEADFNSLSLLGHVTGFSPLWICWLKHSHSHIHTLVHYHVHLESRTPRNLMCTCWRRHTTHTFMCILTHYTQSHTLTHINTQCVHLHAHSCKHTHHTLAYTLTHSYTLIHFFCRAFQSREDIQWEVGNVSLKLRRDGLGSHCPRRNHRRHVSGWHPTAGRGCKGWREGAKGETLRIPEYMGWPEGRGEQRKLRQTRQGGKIVKKIVCPRT
jgi:hypothetical protein